MLFNRRGHRRKPGWGLYYKSRDEPLYEIYYGDQIDGRPTKDIDLAPRWLAIYDNMVISRHQKRSTAIKACEKHAARPLKKTQKRKVIRGR